MKHALLRFLCLPLTVFGITFAPVPGPGFVLRHAPTEEKHLPATMAGGLAIFDYNNDGRPDLFFANGAELPSYRKSGPLYWNRLYRNDGNFRFTDVTEAAGLAGEGFAFGAAAADFDQDGHIDLFVPALPQSKLYRNQGDGTFREVALPPLGPWTVAAAWLDYDNDGRQDLFIVNYLQWSPANNPWCGDRSKKLRVYCHPRHFAATTNQLLRNQGDGTFSDISAASGLQKFPGKGMSASIADYDADGHLDIFVTNDGLPNSLFRNKGDGSFEETAFTAGVALPDRGLAISSMGTDFRDYDNDGKPDLLVTALAGESFPLFRNQGSGQFQEVTVQARLAPLVARKSGWGVVFADFDNDGRKDIFTANSHVNDRIRETSADSYELACSVFLNRDGKTFADATSGSPELAVAVAAHRGAAAADLDGDGRLDVVVTALGAPARIWRNTTRNSNRWAAVSAGVPLNATVTIGAQANTASSSVGYSSSVVGPVHFGLGTAEGEAVVKITAPGQPAKTGRVPARNSP
ncbi:MAG TPA: VCBS repeat-containing protein [Bryobacteraceae bacterium]|nr:VCBS repeat-containing protein [Bryobacteraceae bacterium]